MTVTPELEAWIQESSIESAKVYAILIRDFIRPVHDLLTKFMLEREIEDNLPNAYAIAASLVNYAAAVLQAAGMPKQRVPSALRNTIEVIFPEDTSAIPPKSARKRRRHRRGRKAPR